MIKQRIISNFNTAAATYEAHAAFQHHTADALDRLIGKNIKTPPSVWAEIGCGTGFLTKRLKNRFPHSRALITDIAPAMVKIARKACPNPQSMGTLYAVMDGEYPGFSAVDLIASNLAFQWFFHLPQTLLRLLDSAKTLAFSIFLEEAFHEWRDLCKDVHLPVGLLSFPSLEALLSMLSPYKYRAFEVIERKQEFESALAFLRCLKAIGAHQPRPLYHPTFLRRALVVQKYPFTVTFKVGLVYISVKEGF